MLRRGIRFKSSRAGKHNPSEWDRKATRSPPRGMSSFYAKLPRSPSHTDHSEEQVSDYIRKIKTDRTTELRVGGSIPFKSVEITPSQSAPQPNWGPTRGAETTVFSRLATRQFHKCWETTLSSLICIGTSDFGPPTSVRTRLSRT